MENNNFRCLRCKKENLQLSAPNWMFTRNPIIKIICVCMGCGCEFELIISLSNAFVLEENILRY
jgi:DNA-directed RNA polymerase subunit RPC12/RpoP